MKRNLILGLVGGVMLVAGFFGGRAFQDTKNGYQYKLLEEKEYASPLGPIKWTCFLESVGMSFLAPETTMISMGNRTLYKAQRDFQENDPRARNIVTSGNSIAWEDGDFSYHLTVEPMAKGKPDGSADRSQPIQPGTNPATVPSGVGR